MIGRRTLGAARAAAAAAATIATATAAAPGVAGAAPAAQNGAAVREHATGFPSLAERRIGPIGIVFDRSSRLYVSALEHLYRFGPAGGPAAQNRLSAAPVARLTTGLAFGKDGRLYAARYTAERAGDVVELDPATGAVRRSLIGDIPCPTALATDPISGDLFVSTVGCGSTIGRISDPSGSPQGSVFLSGLTVDGLTFAPDGTLYIAHEPDGSGRTVSAVAGTASPSPGDRRGLASVPNADGVALATPARAGDPPPFLVVNRTDGAVTRVDLGASGTATGARDLVVGGSRGDLIAVGDDGCLYATQTDSVLKVTNADGSCRPASAGTGTGSGSGGAGGSGGDDGGSPASPDALALGRGLQPTSVASRSLTPRCPATSRVRVRVAFRGRRLRSARVFVGGARVKTVRGRALRRPVVLRKLPARAFTVTVRGRLRSGRTVVRRTRYAACGVRVLKPATRRG